MTFTRFVLYQGYKGDDQLQFTISGQYKCPLSETLIWKIIFKSTDVERTKAAWSYIKTWKSDGEIYDEFIVEEKDVRNNG